MNDRPLGYTMIAPWVLTFRYWMKSRSCDTDKAEKNELRMKSGSEFQKYISAHCLLCSNQLFDCLLSDKLNMVNDVTESPNQNEDFDYCLNPESRWRCFCGLWSPQSSLYSLQVPGQRCYFQT